MVIRGVRDYLASVQMADLDFKLGHIVLCGQEKEVVEQRGIDLIRLFSLGLSLTLPATS